MTVIQKSLDVKYKFVYTVYKRWIMKDVTLFFDNIPIRKKMIDGAWWISAVDTAKAIGYANPSRDANKIIQRNSERFKGYTTRVKMVLLEGIVKKERTITMLNLKGVIALCMLSKHENAVPFQRWADKVLEEHIKEKVKRKQIYGEITNDSIHTRKLETEQWGRHGAKGRDFGTLTKKEYQLIFGNDDIRKGDMDGEQLLKLMISNAANALSLMNKEEPIGVTGIDNQMHKTVKMIDSITDGT